MRAISLAVVVAAGFFFRGYHDTIGGALYEVFWCLLAAVVNHRWRPAPIALTVFAATCVLEFLQLWHPPLLELARSNFVARAILGSFFDWCDFIYYVVGSFAGYLWLKRLPAA